MGSRTKGKKKPKSYKAKITSKMGSKRRAQRMGKELKKGQKGAAASFITRARVLRRLQISLKDFRRLCILKGVYPRDPSKKAAGKDKTYYHIKDVAFLSHEPLIEHFRAFKAFMKKIRRTVGRGETADARRRELRAKPTYTLNHLVKERYPRFIDAVRDLDDALSLVHLFASLPQVRAATGERTQTCMRLVREWQLYCSKAGCLNKVFVSIKGVYFQCEVVGQPVTWIAPHSFSQHYPHDVDFSIMLTFLEFYEVLLKFVMFRLYSSLGLRCVKFSFSSVFPCAPFVKLPGHGFLPSVLGQKVVLD
jgi:pescadillo protein